MKRGFVMGLLLLMNVTSIILFVFSIIAFIIGRKWSVREGQRVERKKKEIEAILESADQMINELNNFSDYVIDSLKEQAQEVKNMLMELEDQMQFSKRELLLQKEEISELNEYQKLRPFINKNVLAYNKMKTSHLGDYVKTKKLTRDIASLSPKSKEILSLSADGLNETEIAKRLNIGRGEIQLILGMQSSVAN
jgi:DNA-binding NarL/FixJ family response regulator